jgi:tellurite resistance protein TehA-like permease
MSPDEKRQIRRVMPIGIIGLIMVISAKFFTSSGGKEGGITTTGWILFGIGFLFLLTAFVAIFRLIRRGYRGD